jgi:hypothetical protein
MGILRPTTERIANAGFSRWARVLLSGLLGLFLGSAVAVVQADSYDERRLRTGARVFRSLLASQVGLAANLPPQAKLRIGIYAGNDLSFEQAVAGLRPSTEGAGSLIQNHPVEMIRLTGLPAVGDSPNGGFLASAPPYAELEGLISWSIEHGVALYSPFEGHVERGVLGGLSIEDKVRIYLNQDALRRSGIVLKPLFLKVAKVYP